MRKSTACFNPHSNSNNLIILSILGIIPARYASTRFPGKPLVMIEGKTMIRRVYEGALAAAITDDLVVATDDSRIFDEVKSFGGNSLMTSPGHSSGTERCREALDSWEKLRNTRFDHVINIQGDEPFIQPDHLQKVAFLLIVKMAQVATLVHKIDDPDSVADPNVVKVVMAEDNTALYFSRSSIPYDRRGEPGGNTPGLVYLKHIGIYGYQSQILREITQLKPTALEKAESLEQLRWLGHGIRISLATTSVESIAVDVPADLLKITNRT